MHKDNLAYLDKMFASGSQIDKRFLRLFETIHEAKCSVSKNTKSAFEGEDRPCANKTQVSHVDQEIESREESIGNYMQEEHLPIPNIIDINQKKSRNEKREELKAAITT